MLVCGAKGSGSVKALTEYFDSVWNLPEAKPPKGSTHPHTAGRALLESHYEALPELYPEAFAPVDFQSLTDPVDRITLLTNPPQARNKVPTLLASLIAQMDKGEDILIETPYIICNHTMYQALSDLTEAEKSVQILTNSPDKGANPCGCADFLNHRWRLRKTGAEIWEYAAERSSHTKTILIDDTVSIVGSFNFDMRSTYLDTETMLVIESSQLNRQLRDLNSQARNFSSSIRDGGEVLEGENYVKPPFSAAREMFYGLLRILILPLRHLL